MNAAAIESAEIPTAYYPRWPDADRPPPALPEPPVAELAAAIAAAQAEMRNPTFDRINTAFARGPAPTNPNYASLASVRNAVVPVLGKHGVAVLQNVVTQDGAIECTTLLIHKTGQSLTFGPLRVPVPQASAQAIGSATTYARRFQLMAVAGVAGDEDDDGESVGGAPQPEFISDEQVANLEALMTEVGANRANFLKYCKVGKLSEIRVANYAAAVRALEDKRSTGGAK
jgi:hypothetical protein